MTDNEIIKCLKHCRAGDCEKCKALGACNATFSFHKNALDLINRQKAEIERLNIELQSMRSAANSYKMHYEKAQIEIDRLQKNIDGLNIFTTNHIKVIRLQAMKEFAERLKIRFAGTISCNYGVIKQAIDNLVKEMTEVSE